MLRVPIRQCSPLTHQWVGVTLRGHTAAQWRMTRESLQRQWIYHQVRFDHYCQLFMPLLPIEAVEICLSASKYIIPYFPDYFVRVLLTGTIRGWEQTRGGNRLTLQEVLPTCSFIWGPLSHSVYLSRCWHHSHDKCSQALFLRFCILQTIKNWMVGRVIDVWIGK